MSRSSVSASHSTPATPEKASPNGLQLYRRLLVYLKSYWWMFLLIILGFGLNALTEVGVAQLMQRIIDAITRQDRAFINLFPAFIVLLFVVRGLGTFLGNYYSALISRNLVYRLRTEVFNRLIHLPASYYLSTPSGQISSKLIYDVEQVTAVGTEALKTILRDGFVVIALLGYLFYSNWRLSLTLFLVLPFVAILVRQASRRFRKLSRQIQDSMGEVSHIVNEAINGYAVVKNYVGYHFESSRFNRASLENLHKGMKVVITSSINTPVIQLLMAMAMATVVWLALRPQMLGNVTAGEFVAYIGAAGLLSKPVRSLTEVNEKIQRGLSAAQSVFELLDTPPEKDHGQVKDTIRGDIRFEHVSFHYPDGAEAIKDFDLNLKAGETLAIVGRSGAGKSTLTNLLVRFIEPSSGRILVDDIPLDDWELNRLREQIAIVGQQVVLFDATIRQNIAYGELASRSDAEVQAAARAAYADEFIQKLPDKYETRLGPNGLTLSGGQRQRLAIARAILKQAPILVLDEATSALDNESEHFIQLALEEAMRDITTIVIAHRLSTIEKADRIAVMDQGRLVELGTHAELLAQNGLYAQLYQRQFSE